MTSVGHNSESGMTLLEVILAMTLAAVLSVFLMSSSGDFLFTLEEQDGRTVVLMNANVARARMIADTEGASSVSCSASDLLLINSGGTSIEYSVSDGELLRWSLPPGEDSLVAESAVSLDCTDLGTDGVAVGVTLGDSIHPYYLHIRVSETGA